eukprot:Skav214426  [mRNA]  locus=scaffold586:301002:301996:+ [translate_table: standard]
MVQLASRHCACRPFMGIVPRKCHSEKGKDSPLVSMLGAMDIAAAHYEGPQIIRARSGGLAPDGTRVASLRRVGRAFGPRNGAQDLRWALHREHAQRPSFCLGTGGCADGSLERRLAVVKGWYVGS